DRAEEIRNRIGDMAASARNVAVRGTALYQGRQRESSQELARTALERFKDLGPEDPAMIDLALLQARSAISTGEYDVALATAERLVIVAERLGLARIVAETLVIKGVVYFYRGRLWEARAVLEGARIVAQSFSLPEVELRAIHNLGLGIGLDDPRAAVDLERLGLALARRLGERATEVVLLGNASEDSRRTGDWSWAMAELASAIQLDIDAASRRAMAVVHAAFLAYQGALSNQALEALTQDVQGIEDTDIAAGTFDVTAALAAATGDWRGAYEAYIATADNSVLNAPYALPPAGIFAIVAGDAPLARGVLDRLQSIGTRGRAVDANRLAIEGGILALEGDPAGGLAAFRQSVALLGDLGLSWDEVWVVMAAVARLGADDPEIASWVERARETLERVGALPVLTQLNQLVAEKPSGTTGGEQKRKGAAPVAGSEVAG
ncbi:MAG TPA: hypothetical protein VEX41_03200, partial [Candidatus Eisenbacteria bacterium]|nr:hypothetical protein [Candidatus Eisenbacteria bacterium]